MKTIQQHQETISEARLQLLAAKSPARKSRLRKRIEYAEHRIRQLTGKANRPLTDEEWASLTPAEYFARLPFALRELAHESGLTPPACREAVEQEVAEERRQQLLNHPGVVIATTNDPELRAAWEAEATEARRVQAEERERLAAKEAQL